MAFFIQCDVKGCDEIVPTLYQGEVPSRWIVLSFEVEDEEEKQVLMAKQGISSDMPMRMSLKRNVYICPEHELPEFDPEPGFKR